MTLGRDMSRDRNSKNRDTEGVTALRAHALVPRDVTVSRVTTQRNNRRDSDTPAPGRSVTVTATGEGDEGALEQLGPGASFRVESWVNYSDDKTPWVRVRLEANGRKGWLAWSPKRNRFARASELAHMRRHARRWVEELERVLRARYAPPDPRFAAWLAGATAEQQARWERLQQQGATKVNDNDLPPALRGGALEVF